MDLRTYFQLFWASAIVSAALHALLWLRGSLSGRAQAIYASWFLVATAAQLRGAAAGLMWGAGLAAHTALAIVLLLQHQVGEP